MDLRAEFREILKNYGHNILLQRREDPHATPGNPIYSNTLEQHTVRYTFNPSGSSSVLMGIRQEQSEGIAHDFEKIYYFMHDVFPREGDRIYENLEGFPNELNTFLIDYAAPMRGANGRIEYWACSVLRETPT